MIYPIAQGILWYIKVLSEHIFISDTPLGGGISTRICIKWHHLVDCEIIQGEKICCKYINTLSIILYMWYYVLDISIYCHIVYDIDSIELYLHFMTTFAQVCSVKKDKMAASTAAANFVRMYLDRLSFKNKINMSISKK